MARQRGLTLATAPIIGNRQAGVATADSSGRSLHLFVFRRGAAMPCLRSAACFRSATIAATLTLLSAAHAQTPPLVLEVTVGSDPDPASCAETDTLAITAGDLVNFCYTVRNDSAHA